MQLLFVYIEGLNYTKPIELHDYKKKISICVKHVNQDTEQNHQYNVKHIR